MEIVELCKRHGTFKHVSELLVKNMEYEKLLLKAIEAGEGSDKQKDIMAEMEAMNVKMYEEATAKIEKAQENKRKAAARLEKAREEK